jgi:hypothetical protein
MPRLNLRSIPLPSDANEGALRDVAKVHGYAVRFDGVARRTGKAHVCLYAHGDRAHLPTATFARSSDAIRWLEERHERA